jgi:hypothetical protein
MPCEFTLIEALNLVGGLSLKLPEEALNDVESLGAEVHRVASDLATKPKPTDASVVVINDAVRKIAEKHRVQPAVVSVAVADNSSKRLLHETLRQYQKAHSSIGDSVDREEFADFFNTAFKLDRCQKEPFEADLQKVGADKRIDLLAFVPKRRVLVPFRKWQDVPDIVHHLAPHASSLRRVVESANACAGDCQAQACDYCPNCERVPAELIRMIITCGGDPRCEQCFWDKYSECHDRQCCLVCLLWAIGDFIHTVL